MRQAATWPRAVCVVHDDEETKAELALGTGRWFMDHAGSGRRTPSARTPRKSATRWPSEGRWSNQETG